MSNVFSEYLSKNYVEIPKIESYLDNNPEFLENYRIFHDKFCHRYYRYDELNAPKTYYFSHKIPELILSRINYWIYNEYPLNLAFSTNKEYFDYRSTHNLILDNSGRDLPYSIQSDNSAIFYPLFIAGLLMYLSDRDEISLTEGTIFGICSWFNFTVLGYVLGEDNPEEYAKELTLKTYYMRERHV